jgi:branched-chain amino acid transport system ATP-binding protein
MLRIDALTSHYGRIPALKGVDLTVEAGELVVLVGGNGAGKTTLLRAISGVQPVSGGGVWFDGQDITRLKPHQRVALGIIQVPEGRQVFGALSIEDNLRLGAIRRQGDCDLERIYGLFPILKERRLHAAAADSSRCWRWVGR